MHIHRPFHRRSALIPSKPSFLVARSFFPTGPPTTFPVSATYHNPQVGPYVTSSDIARRNVIAHPTTSCYADLLDSYLPFPCPQETTTRHVSTSSIKPRSDPTPTILPDILTPGSITTASPSPSNLAPRAIHWPFKFFMDEGTNHCYKYPRSYHVGMGIFFLAFAIVFVSCLFFCVRSLVRRKARQTKVVREAAVAYPKGDYKHKRSTGRNKGGKYENWNDEDVTVERKWYHIPK